MTGSDEWSDWLARFPDRPLPSDDPYDYARRLTAACHAPLPAIETLDIPTRIAVARRLQDAVIDLLRIQNLLSPARSWGAILLAFAGFMALQIPNLAPLVAIAEIFAGFQIAYDEIERRTAHRAIVVAQARIDELVTLIGGAL